MATQVDIYGTVTREQAEQEYPGWGGKAWDSSRETMDAQIKFATEVAAKRIENTRTNGNAWQEIQTAIHVLAELLPFALMFVKSTGENVPLHVPDTTNVMDGLEQLMSIQPSHKSNDEETDIDLNSTTG